MSSSFAFLNDDQFFADDVDADAPPTTTSDSSEEAVINTEHQQPPMSAAVATARPPSPSVVRGGGVGLDEVALLYDPDEQQQAAPLTTVERPEPTPPTQGPMATPPAAVANREFAHSVDFQHERAEPSLPGGYAAPPRVSSPSAYQALGPDNFNLFNAPIPPAPQAALAPVAAPPSTSQPNPAPASAAVPPVAPQSQPHYSQLPPPQQHQPLYPQHQLSHPQQQQQLPLSQQPPPQQQSQPPAAAASAAGAYPGTIAAVPSNNPYSSQPPPSHSAGQAHPPPSAQQQSQASIPVGLPVQPGTGEVMCPFCSVRLRYPLGSELVRCGSCQSISRIPPPSNHPPHQPYSYPPPQSYPPQPAPWQHLAPINSAAPARVQFQCSGCSTWLQADLSAGGVTRCPTCQTLLRPMVNLAQQQPPIVQQLPPQQVQRPATVQQPAPAVSESEQQRQMQNYCLANGLPYPPPNAQAQQSPSWLAQQHQQVVQQQQQLLAQAQANKAARAQAQGQQAAPAPAVAPISHAPPPQQQPQSHQPLAHQRMSSAGSSLVGHPAAPKRASVGDYSSASNVDFRPQPLHYAPAPSAHYGAPPAVVAHSNYVPAPSASPEQKDAEAASDASFQAQMSQRLEALRVDHKDEEDATPSGAYRPQPTRAKAKSELAAPLLANSM